MTYSISICWILLPILSWTLQLQKYWVERWVERYFFSERERERRKTLSEFRALALRQNLERAPLSAPTQKLERHSTPRSEDISGAALHSALRLLSAVLQVRSGKSIICNQMALKMVLWGGNIIVIRLQLTSWSDKLQVAKKFYWKIQKIPSNFFWISTCFWVSGVQVGAERSCWRSERIRSGAPLRAQARKLEWRSTPRSGY